MTRCWQGSWPLTAVGQLMLALTPVALAGVVLDSRVVLGAPAWLKPAKFAVSTGIFMLTLAWVLSYLPQWRRLRGVVGWATSLIFVFEVAVIAYQASRGVASHFNVGTNFDAILFLAMGAGIMLQTLMTVLVLLALLVSSFDDAALGWALRLGVAISIAGASVGVWMTRPSDAQRVEAQANGGRYITNGAHSIGGPDGGPGLPFTGWSTEHGDLRVAHFVGLHAIQVLPIVALMLRRYVAAPDARTPLVFAAAFAYAGVFAVLLSQALRGQPLIPL